MLRFRSSAIYYVSVAIAAILVIISKAFGALEDCIMPFNKPSAAQPIKNPVYHGWHSTACEAANFFYFSCSVDHDLEVTFD